MMRDNLEAYLDIETTGLSPGYSEITVVGIYLSNGVTSNIVQLMGADITAGSLLEALEGVGTVYTYNGSRFDLPFIKSCLDVDLASLFEHCDLMYHCWRNNLFGGLKAVERQIGIVRQRQDIDGREAIRLWWRYLDAADEDALETLLEYNREDVINLPILKERLFTSPSLP